MRHAPKASQFEVPFTTHRPSAEPNSAKPIFTTLSSRKDGIHAQCDRCRTTCFKMDSRIYRKQHRRDKGKCEERDSHKNICGQFFSGALFGGMGMEPQAFCLLGKHCTSELYPQPHKQYRRQSGGGQDSTWSAGLCQHVMQQPGQGSLVMRNDKGSTSSEVSFLLCISFMSQQSSPNECQFGFLKICYGSWLFVIEEKSRTNKAN